MTLQPRPRGRRRSPTRGPVPWLPAVAMAVMSLGWTGAVISLASLVAAGALLVPALNVQNNIEGVTPPRLGIVLQVRPGGSTDVRVKIHAEYTAFGPIMKGRAGTEAVTVTMLPPEGQTSRIAHAVMLFGGPAERAWRCGFVYTTPALKGSLMAMMFPKDVAKPASDTKYSSLLIPQAKKPFTSELSLTPTISKPDYEVAGVECVRDIPTIASNSAGNRWFSLTDVAVGATTTDATDRLWPSRDVNYTQDVDIVTPRTWTETSGLIAREGSSMATDWLEDQIAVNGSVDIALPARLDPPGVTQAYVYQDSAVSQSITIRTSVGWAVFGAWFAYVFGIVCFRVSQLRREDHQAPL